MSLQNDEYDPFAGSTGLREGPAIVVDSYFATDPQYNQGKTLSLYLKKQFDDGEEIVDRYSCGPDWMSYDDGETAEHPKDTDRRPQGFNVNSQIMELLNATFATGVVVEHSKPNAMYPEGRPVTDVEKHFREVSATQYENRGLRDARVWIGYKAQWGIKTETKKFKDRDTQEMVERTTSKSLPVHFLGWGDVSTVAGNEFQDAQTNVGNVTLPPPPAPPSPAPTPPPPPPATAANVDNPSQPAAPSQPAPPPIPSPPPIPQPEPPAQPQPVAQPEPAPAPEQTAAAPQPSPAVAPPAPPAQGADPLASLVNAETSAQIRVLAQTQPYHEWVDSVMAIPGVAAIPQLVTQLGDDALYNSLHAG